VPVSRYMYVGFWVLECDDGVDDDENDNNGDDDDVDDDDDDVDDDDDDNNNNNSDDDDVVDDDDAVDDDDDDNNNSDDDDVDDNDDAVDEDDDDDNNSDDDDVDDNDDAVDEDDDDDNNSDDHDVDDDDDLDVEELGWRKEGGRAVELIGVKTVLSCERQVDQRVSVQVHKFQMTEFTWRFNVTGVHQHVRGCTCTQRTRSRPVYFSHLWEWTLTTRSYIFNYVGPAHLLRFSSQRMSLLQSSPEYGIDQTDLTTRWQVFLASMNSSAQLTGDTCMVNCRYNHSIVSLHLCKKYLTAVK